MTRQWVPKSKWLPASKTGVRRAMERAAERFGGDDGIFNAAGFSNAMVELSSCQQGLDGYMVRFILSGRQDVREVSPGASHYQILGEESP